MDAPGSVKSCALLSADARWRRVRASLIVSPVILVLALLLILLYPASVFAQSQSPTEYQIKAAYLSGFTKFVFWPDADAAGDDPEFVVGVVGKDPFGATLDQAFSNTDINGRKVKVAIQRLSWDEDLRNCQLIFIAQSERKHQHEILAKLRDSNVLTVSDIPSFYSEGGMIGFVFDVDRIRFEINLDAASRSHLKISSKLLHLASSVKGHSSL